MKMVLNESIASSRISNFLRNHGGLSSDSPKDGLGDISDDAIVTCQEVSSAKEAVDIVFRNHRSKDFYIWYLANDGSAIVVAVDRTKFDTGHIYGWNSSKKHADRYWEKERPDGRETYKYNPFVAYHAGVKNNADFQNKKYWAPILNPDREGAARKLASKRATYDALRENLKLTETDVRQMVAECTRRILKEYTNTPRPGFGKLYKMKWDYRYLFGMFRGKSVEETMNAGVRGKEYVAWVYYNMEYIDYDESILTALNITPIEKPGVNKEAYEAWKVKYHEGLSDEEKEGTNKYMMGKISHNKKMKKDWARALDSKISRYDAIDSNKGKLQWKNQGH